MEDKGDIRINLPAEHFAALSEVFATGLQRAKLDPVTRKELKAWWEAEKEFIEDEING